MTLFYATSAFESPSLSRRKCLKKISSIFIKKKKQLVPSFKTYAVLSYKYGSELDTNASEMLMNYVLNGRYFGINNTELY